MRLDHLLQGAPNQAPCYMQKSRADTLTGELLICRYTSRRRNRNPYRHTPLSLRSGQKDKQTNE
jgi:hypothetical protein